MSWRVSGQVIGKLATLTATDPKPAVNKCGISSAQSITARLTPGCATGTAQVDIQKAGK